jgi:hypothetical protein
MRDIPNTVLLGLPQALRMVQHELARLAATDRTTLSDHLLVKHDAAVACLSDMLTGLQEETDPSAYVVTIDAFDDCFSAELGSPWSILGNPDGAVN